MAGVFRRRSIVVLLLFQCLSADGFGKRICANAKERKHPTPHLPIFKFDFFRSDSDVQIQVARFLLQRGRCAIRGFEQNISVIYSHVGEFGTLDLPAASSQNGIGSRPPKTDGLPVCLSIGGN